MPKIHLSTWNCLQRNESEIRWFTALKSIGRNSYAITLFLCLISNLNFVAKFLIFAFVCLFFFFFYPPWVLIFQGQKNVLVIFYPLVTISNNCTKGKNVEASISKSISRVSHHPIPPLKITAYTPDSFVLEQRSVSAIRDKSM